MTHIGALFESYKKRLRPPQQSVVRVFVEVVDEVLGVTIAVDDVTYNTYTKMLHLAVPGLVKNEIKLHEEEVLSHLRGRLGEHEAPKGVV